MPQRTVRIKLIPTLPSINSMTQIKHRPTDSAPVQEVLILYPNDSILYCGGARAKLSGLYDKVKHLDNRSEYSKKQTLTSKLTKKYFLEQRHDENKHSVINFIYFTVIKCQCSRSIKTFQVSRH